MTTHHCPGCKISRLDEAFPVGSEYCQRCARGLEVCGRCAHTRTAHNPHCAVCSELGGPVCAKWIEGAS